MTDQISIRNAEIRDAALLSAIGQASFRDAYEKWTDPADLVAHLDEVFSEDAIREAIETPGCQYLVANNGGTAAGFVKIRDSINHEAVPAARALELQQVYVLPNQQRYGIGGQLIEAAVRYAAEQISDGVWLSVWEDAPWAVNCYRKYGFEAVGKNDFRLGNSIFNDLIMWLPVSGRKSE